MNRRKFLASASAISLLSGCVTINRYEGAGNGPEPDTTAFGEGAPATQVETTTTASSRDRRTDRVEIDEGPTQDTDRIEAHVHWRVNDARIANDVRELNFSEDIRKVAQVHSQDMAHDGYFAHEAPDGRTFKPNVCDSWGENIYRESGFGRDPAGVAERAVSGWLESPGHRRNLLNPMFGSEGIGAAVASDGTIYITQSLC